MNNAVISSLRKTPLKGEITIPPDKSISHRSIILGALTGSRVKISNFSLGADCKATLEIFKNLGVEVEFLDEKNLILNSPKSLIAPKNMLNCGNSGTSMRLLSGFFAGKDFNCTLFGDESLSKRPMKRVIEPLEQMGAHIESNEFRAPLKIFGKKLHSIDYFSKIPSAQVKSCILLAGLSADGLTVTREPVLSRNHTERLLKYLGADIQTGKDSKGFFASVKKSVLEPKDIAIAGDISSAAFFMVMAAVVPNSEIIIKNVGLNPTRTGILDVFDKMKINYEILDKKLVSNEEVGDIKISFSPDLCGVDIKGDLIPRLIDEIPIIAVLASFASGKTTVSNAQDLRNKESDRISAIVSGLTKIGVEITEKPDGFEIEGNAGKNFIGGVELETHLDHRLAMSYFCAGLISEKPIKINDFNWVNTSFPEFLNLYEAIS